MRKKLMLRLCLILLVALSAYSCRTDQFHENETYNDSSKFQLTSKRISLDEAKHKTQLVPELEKAEVGIQDLAKKNVSGKGIDLGSGVTIDTQNVLYMENGPNYHTYTFNIQRSNPLPNAPVENLVLTPLPQGSYKAYIVAYNFTEVEKNTILNGGNVSVNGKSSVTPLEGTFASVMSVESCTMQISDYYTWCSEGIHNHGEVEPKCKADHKSQHVVVMEFVCQGGNSPEPGIEGPIDYGSGEAGGAVPCSANGVYLQPQDPANTSCNGAVVTQPVLEFNPTTKPCERIKAQASDVNYNSKVAFLKGKTNESFEYGFRVGNPMPGSGQTTVQYQQLSNYVGTNTLNFTIFSNTFGFMHSHHEALVPIFSPDDINSFIKMLKNAANNNMPLDTVYMTLVNPDGTIYQLWGSNSIDVSSLTIFPQTIVDKILNKIYTGKDYELNKANQSPQFYQENFLKFMKEYMNVEGAKMYSIDDYGKGSLVSLNGNSLAAPVPCPN